MLVARYRSRINLAIRPVDRIKHVVDKQQGISAGTTVFDPLITSKDAPVIANTNEVQTGSKVNGIYLRVEAYATTSGALANFYMYVGKSPGNSLTLPNPNVVGASVLKKYIIHQEMVMMEQSVNGNPRTVFNGVIKIPRGYIRNGPDDQLFVAFLAPGVNVSVCFQCHYKEFR